MSNPPPPGEPTPPGEPQPPQPPYVPPAGSVPPQPGQGTPPPPGYGQQQGYGQRGYGQPGPDGYQQTGAYGYFPPPAPNPTIDEAKGFFASLFDFSFTHFVTPKIVKFVYILVLVILVISWLFITVGAFIGAGAYGYSGYGAGRIVAGLVALIGGPFLIVLYLAIIRMTFEFYVAMIRTAENTGKLVEQGKKD